MRRLLVLLTLAGIVAGLFCAPALASTGGLRPTPTVPTHTLTMPPPPLPTAPVVTKTLPVVPEPGVEVVARGLDTSLRPTLAQYKAMRAAGYEFCGRYLAIPGGSKIYPVTRTELANARAAGVGIFLIFEWCDWTHLPRTYAQGVQDGRLAQQALRDLGLPASTVVYFSLDRAHRRATTAQITAYFQGVYSVIGDKRAIGCYGSKAWLLELRAQGLIGYLWYATWMDGNNLPFAGWGNHMYQRTILTYPGGVPCDRNYALTLDLGLVR